MVTFPSGPSNNFLKPRVDYNLWQVSVPSVENRFLIRQASEPRRVWANGDGFFLVFDMEHYIQTLYFFLTTWTSPTASPGM